MAERKSIFQKPRTVILIAILTAIIIYLLNANKLIPDYPERYNFIIVLLIIVWGFSYFLRRYIVFIKSKKWLPASAVVERCEVVRTEDSDGTMYTPVLVYKYKAGNDEFSSDRVYPHDLFLASSFESISRKFIEKYTKNQVIKIFYNPVRPAESYIERKGILPVILILCILIFFFILFLLIIFNIINLE